MITTTTIISSFTICIFAIYIIFSPAITKHIDQAPTSNFLHVRLSELRNQRNFYRWNPEKGKFSLVKSGILGFEVRHSAQRIRNPSSTDKQSGIPYQEWKTTVLNPESKTVLGPVYVEVGDSR